MLVAVGSMVVSPLLVPRSAKLAAALAKFPVMRRLDHRQLLDTVAKQPPLENHLIIAGYGLNGRNVAHALQTFGLPFVVLEMNPDTVHAAQRRGDTVVFGDCSRVEVLRKLHIDKARGMVLAISDARATRQAVQIARHENPSLHIIVRTRYLSEIDILKELGANDVVAEEFETSLEVLTLAMQLLQSPRSEVDAVIKRLRANAYRSLRGEVP